MKTPHVAGLGLLAALLAPQAALAQIDDYPSRPVRMILPFPPGGSTDRIGRLVADKMTAGLKQPVVVDYRPGAGGNIGNGAAAKSQPDGYTVVLTSVTIAISKVMYRKLDYDAERDLAPVGLAARIPTLIVVHPSVPARTLEELTALARQSPGKLNFGSGGVGTSNHLAAEMYLSLAKIRMVHVPYKSTAQALLAMITGETDMVVISTTAALPVVRQGKLRALAVLRDQRIPVLPDLPTTTEAGLPDWQVNTWYGVFTRAGTPQPVVTKLNAALVQGLKDPDSAEKLGLVGAEPLTSTPEELGRFLSEEVQRLRKVVSEEGIKPF